MNNETFLKKIFLFQEYELDGVDWTRVEFEDNEECLNLIEKVSMTLFFSSKLAWGFLSCFFKLFVYLYTHVYTYLP